RADVAARLEALGLAHVAAQDALALARALDPGASPSALFHRAATDLRYAEPARRFAAAHVGPAPAPVLYPLELAGAARRGHPAAFHGLELPLLFGTRRVAPLGRFFDDVPQAKAVGRRMRDAWAAFARSGDPRAPLTEPWPAYTAEDRALLVFDESPHVE